MGLSYLKNNAPDLSQNPDMLAFVQNYTDMGFLSILLFCLYRYHPDHDCAGFGRHDGHHADYVCQRLDQL